MEDAADLVLLSICSPEPDFDEHHRQVVGDAEGRSSHRWLPSPALAQGGVNFRGSRVADRGIVLRLLRGSERKVAAMTVSRPNTIEKLDRLIVKLGVGLSRSRWRSKALRVRQHFHDLPPIVG